MDFSEELKRMYVRDKKEVDPRITDLLVRLTQTPDMTRVQLGRVFTQGTSGQGIKAHKYVPVMGAVEVSVWSNGYGRRAFVKVPEQSYSRAIDYLANLGREVTRK